MCKEWTKKRVEQRPVSVGNKRVQKINKKVGEKKKKNKAGKRESKNEASVSEVEEEE